MNKRKMKCGKITDAKGIVGSVHDLEIRFHECVNCNDEKCKQKFQKLIKKFYFGGTHE